MVVQKKLDFTALPRELYDELIQFTKCLVRNGMAFQFMEMPNEIFTSYQHLIKAQFTLRKIK